MRSIATLVAVVAAAGISVLHAQGPAEATTSGPTFKSSTRLIQVSVVVQDGRRRPVADLKAEDFEITEDGKPQPVSVFSVRGQSPSDAAAEASGVFTNRLQSPTGGGAVAIVFDRLNTDFAEQTQARAHIIKYLGQVRPEDRVALFLLDEDGHERPARLQQGCRFVVAGDDAGAVDAVVRRWRARSCSRLPTRWKPTWTRSRAAISRT